MDYKLKGKTNNGNLYEYPQMVMYSLLQALKPSDKKLVYHLAPYGYHPAKCTSENFKHDNKPIKFNLVVEYFGVKFMTKSNMVHLHHTLKRNYTLTMI